MPYNVTIPEELKAQLREKRKYLGAGFAAVSEDQKAGWLKPAVVDEIVDFYEKDLGIHSHLKDLSSLGSEAVDSIEALYLRDWHQYADGLTPEELAKFAKHVGVEYSGLDALPKDLKYGDVMRANGELVERLGKLQGDPEKNKEEIRRIIESPEFASAQKNAKLFHVKAMGAFHAARRAELELRLSKGLANITG